MSYILLLRTIRGFKHYNEPMHVVYVPVRTVNKAGGDTPLSLACANGNLNTIKCLVNKHLCDPIYI